METKQRRRAASRGLRRRVADALRCAGAACARLGRGADARIRPWRPAVCLDLDGGEARWVRRMLRRAARDYIHALGVSPPDALLLVVQRVVVQDGRELSALLQVFEDEAGRRRTVIFLALSVDGREVDDEELPALLRHELQHALAGQLGRLTLSQPFASATPPRRRAAVVPIRGEQESPFEDAPPPDDADWQPVDDGAYPVAAEG